MNETEYPNVIEKLETDEKEYKRPRYPRYT